MITENFNVTDTGFYRFVDNNFGRATTLQLKKWSNTNRRLAALRNRRIFLLNCRRLKVLPRHILDSTTTATSHIASEDSLSENRIRRERCRLAMRLINLELKATFTSIHKSQVLLNELEGQISHNLPYNIFSEFLRKQAIRYNNIFNKVKKANVDKLDRLKKQQHNSDIPVKSEWFKNLTNIIIPKDIGDFLALGPKFALNPHIQNLSLVHLMADITNVTSNLNRDERNDLNARVINVVTNYINQQKALGLRTHSLYQKSKRFLKEHPQALLMNADKGNVTVLIPRDDYERLSYDIINNRQSIQPLSRDPTSTIQQKANKIVSSLRNKGRIDAATAKKLMIYNSYFPTYYGLPKIHKPVLSLRPIISSIQAPNSKIAQWLTDILTEAYNKDNRYFVKDSFEFASFVNGFTLPEGYVLVSLDVTSLFTNIPIELVVNSIQRRWQSISNFCSLTLSEFLELTRFVFDTTYFAYNGQFYKFLIGTPMGATISPIIAQYVMDDLLDDCIARLPFHLPYLKKYVDDTNTAVPEGKEDDVLAIFNSYNEHLQFTIEKENDNAVPFLDVLVIRENNILVTDWYRKKTSSGRYINFFSFHDFGMKINVILGLKRRIYYVSHPKFYHKNIKLLHEILMNNSYPKPLLDRLLFHLTTVYNSPEGKPHPVDPENTNNIAIDRKYFSIPKIDNNHFRKLCNLLQTIPNIKIVPRYITTVRDLYSTLKQRIPKEMKSGVVYSITCNTCTMEYIGQTSRSLYTRLVAHKSDIRLKKKTCKLAEHIVDNQHIANFEEVKLLDQCQWNSKRLFMEMARISQSDSCMNNRTDIDGLSDIFTHIIRIDKDINQRSFFVNREITQT